MKVKFWGVTGSLPAPTCRASGFERGEFGGNTSCLEVKLDEWLPNHVVVFDVGSGARWLGLDLMKRAKPVQAHIFLSHCHWDHVQGLPFFTPLYVPGTRLEFFGLRKTKGFRNTLEEVLSGQQAYPTFPRQIEQCPSVREFRDLDHFGAPVELDLKLDPNGPAATVEYFELHHPDECLGYVLKERKTGRTFAYCTDTEHFSGTANPNITRMCRAVDCMYIDGQFTEDEYTGKTGMPKVTWGHNSTWAAVREAAACGAKRLVIGHHDHYHDDAFLLQMERDAKAIAAKMDYDPSRIWFAREGAEITV